MKELRVENNTSHEVISVWGRRYHVSWMLKEGGTLPLRWVGVSCGWDLSCKWAVQTNRSFWLVCLMSCGLFYRFTLPVVLQAVNSAFSWGLLYNVFLVVVFFPVRTLFFLIIIICFIQFLYTITQCEHRTMLHISKGFKNRTKTKWIQT